MSTGSGGLEDIPTLWSRYTAGENSRLGQQCSGLSVVDDGSGLNSPAEGATYELRNEDQEKLNGEIY
jgi:hypothetical protein